MAGRLSGVSLSPGRFADLAVDKQSCGAHRRSNVLFDRCAAQATRVVTAETGKQACQSGNADLAKIDTQASSSPGRV